MAAKIFMAEVQQQMLRDVVASFCRGLPLEYSENRSVRSCLDVGRRSGVWTRAFNKPG